MSGRLIKQIVANWIAADEAERAEGRMRSRCCARAASGHTAAAPPSGVMNSRSPRRSGRAASFLRPLGPELLEANQALHKA
jgi:hypothetical protein